MIKIKQEEIFDLNKIGLYLSLFIALIMVLYPIKLLYLILIEVFLLSYGYYLHVCIKQKHGISIMINTQEKWYVEQGGVMSLVSLKDYWFLKQYLFIWAKGKEKSVSFVVTRSIIGEQKFSQLRALIK